MVSHCKVRADTAMTGEMTLRGLVLPVGGVKDKVILYRFLIFSLFPVYLEKMEDLTIFYAVLFYSILTSNFLWDSGSCSASLWHQESNIARKKLKRLV